MFFDIIRAVITLYHSGKVSAYNAKDSTITTGSYEDCIITGLSSVSNRSSEEVMTTLLNKLRTCVYVRYSSNVSGSIEEAAVTKFLTKFGFHYVNTTRPFPCNKLTLIRCNRCQVTKPIPELESKVVTFGNDIIERACLNESDVCLQREHLSGTDTFILRTFPSKDESPAELKYRKCEIVNFYIGATRHRPDINALTMKQALYEMRECPIIHMPQIYPKYNEDSIIMRNIASVYGFEKVQWNTIDDSTTSMVRCNSCHHKR